jgi:Zn finger protein HypA/HybF involved in hydrogenase expression
MSGSDEDVAEKKAFYHSVQRNSHWINCRCCGKRVKLKKDYNLCNSCADAQERGYQY